MVYFSSTIIGAALSFIWISLVFSGTSAFLVQSPGGQRNLHKPPIHLLPKRNNNDDVGGDDVESTDTITTNDDDSDRADKSLRIRYRARVAYDGSSFKGWQVQAKGRTVQGEIENVLSRRFNRTMKIVGAGRTDAGVHARGQAFHFDIYSEDVVVKDSQKIMELDKHKQQKKQEEDQQGLTTTTTTTTTIDEQFCHILQKSLNSMLPQDIRVWNISRCPPPVSVTRTLADGSESTRMHKWHVIYNSKQKLYVYRISMGPDAITTDPLERYTRVHVEGNIDIDYLREVLKHYEGTHDFRAFAGAIEANQRKDGIEHKNTVRTVYNVTVIEEGEGKFRIEILLKGALYKMVRNMVGTALDVCKGRVDEAYMLQMLHHSSQDGSKQFVRKDNKCKPAPPEGLELARVDFDDDW